MRFVYRRRSWSKGHSTYGSKPPSFVEKKLGFIDEHDKVSTYIQFFEKFWTYNMLKDISIETNRCIESLDK